MKNQLNKQIEEKKNMIKSIDKTKAKNLRVDNKDNSN